MIPGLEPVPLRELQALGSVREWEFEGQLEELTSLTPVRGTIRAEHRGNILEVSGSAPVSYTHLTLPTILLV